MTLQQQTVFTEEFFEIHITISDPVSAVVLQDVLKDEEYTNGGLMEASGNIYDEIIAKTGHDWDVRNVADHRFRCKDNLVEVVIFAGFDSSLSTEIKQEVYNKHIEWVNNSFEEAYKYQVEDSDWFRF